MIGKVQRLFKAVKIFCMASGGSGGKELACNAGAAGEAGSILGSGRSLGEENGNPLQYSCLGNPMDRETWQATGHGVTNRIGHSLVTKQQQSFRTLIRICSIEILL